MFLEGCHHCLENVRMVVEKSLVDFEEWVCEMGKKRVFLG